jgi:hypothetical protein
MTYVCIPKITLPTNVAHEVFMQQIKTALYRTNVGYIKSIKLISQPNIRKNKECNHFQTYKVRINITKWNTEDEKIKNVYERLMNGEGFHVIYDEPYYFKIILEQNRNNSNVE